MADRLSALLSGNVAPKARRARAHRAPSASSGPHRRKLPSSRPPTAPLLAQSPAHAHNSLSRGRARPGSLAEPRAPLQSRGRFHRSMSRSHIRPVAQIPKGAGGVLSSDQSRSSARARTVDLGRGVHRSQEGDGCGSPGGTSGRVWDHAEVCLSQSHRSGSESVHIGGAPAFGFGLSDSMVCDSNVEAFKVGVAVGVGNGGGEAAPGREAWSCVARL